MKILITGVAGFIGSHLQDHFVTRGHKVIGVDNLSGGFKRNINPLTDFYDFDLSDDERIKFIFSIEEPELVFHCAADATEGRSQFTPVSATKNNFNASMVVFKNAIKYGAKRIVFTSSMSVYGAQDPPFDEGRPRKPVDIYGINKASSEHALEVLADVHGIEYCIVRPHNVFGERQNIRDAYRNVVGIFMNRIMNGKPPIIYGDGEQRRAFTYIDNLTPYLAKAGTHPDANGKIINIGPTEHRSINDLAKEVAKAMGYRGELVHVEERPLEVKKAYCTVDTARALLNYKTIVSFEEGVKRMAEWAKELGPQEPVYLDELELVNDKTPDTWREKII